MGMAKAAAHMKLRKGAPIPTLLRELKAVLYPLKRPSMYITFACVCDDGRDGLEFAVAGHLPIIHVNAAGAMHERTTPQIPVGVFEHFDIVSARLACAPGDLLAIVTDGLIEVSDRADLEFGLPRLEEYLREHDREPLEAIASGLLNSVRAHGVQIDDQTLLLIRRDAAA